MLAKRIIPCLDIQDGRTVKGVNFIELRDAGNPVELAVKYSKQGADELVFLDITATHEKRKTLTELVKKIASSINIPFTVGGGISSAEDVYALLDTGADKISINSAAIRKPTLIQELAKRFGSQCIVLAIDAKINNNEWYVYMNGGRLKTELKLFDWAKQAQDYGAGEILFTSMNHDGTKNGFAIEPLKKLSAQLNIHVIASGGAGNMEHFAEVFSQANVDAALAAGVFHFGEINIPELKEKLKRRGLSIRL